MLTLKKGLSFKIFIFLILNNFFETAAQICFKKTTGSQENFHINQIQDIPIFIGHLTTSPFLWLALLSVIITFTNWSTILSKVDLSVATPVASFSYILVAIAALFFFHEQITLLRWIGIILILVGVSLVSVSPSKTKT